MKFNDKCGTDLSSSAFDTSLPLCEEKLKKGFPHEEEKGTKYAKGLFSLRVPSLLCFLRAGKRRNHSAKLTIIVKKTVY